MENLTINLPLKLRLGTKRDKTENWFYVNLNEYRNAHHFILNKAKILFKEAIWDQVLKSPSFEYVDLEYVLFPGSNREMDTNNICSIADKFFCDTFVEAKKITDDNFKFVRSISSRFGEVDKTNPRVEVRITGPIKKDTDMQFQAVLNHEDFMSALEAFVKASYPIPSGMKVEMDITAGRKDNGYSAIVTFVPMEASEVVPPKGPVKREASGSTGGLQEKLQAAGNSMNRLHEDAVPEGFKSASMTAPTEIASAPQAEPEEPEAQEAQDEAPSAIPASEPLFAQSGSTPLFAKPVPMVKPAALEGEPAKPKPTFDFGNK